MAAIFVRIGRFYTGSGNLGASCVLSSQFDLAWLLLHAGALFETAST